MAVDVLGRGYDLAMSESIQRRSGVGARLSWAWVPDDDEGCNRLHAQVCPCRGLCHRLRLRSEPGLGLGGVWRASAGRPGSQNGGRLLADLPHLPGRDDLHSHQGTS